MNSTTESAEKLLAIRQLIAVAKRRDIVFAAIGVLALSFALCTFLALFIDMLISGWTRLNPDFFTSFPSRRAENAGILSAWVGSIMVMLVTASTAIPLGVAAAVYLEEYAPANWLTAIIEINISNLAGVPSIVYGLLALGLIDF